MSESRARKHLNKLKGWAKREGLVQVEVAEAMDEFVPNAAAVPAESRDSVQKLFEDWFIWERRLIRTNTTPLELFIRGHERKLTAKDLQIYRRCIAEGSFGLFRVESVDPGEGMELKRITDERIFRVVEISASQEAKGGEYLIARIIPFEDHWEIASLVGAYPSEASYPIERSLSALRGKARAIEFKPRHFLRLLLPKIDWYEQGLPRVKARISMILQRWKVADLTASQLEKDVLEAHSKRAPNHPLFNSVVSRAPSQDDAQEMVELLVAFWNLTIPKDMAKPGPKESMLFRDLSRLIIARLRDEGVLEEALAKEKAKAMMARWLDEPQNELEDRSPRQVILEERQAMGNPRTDLEFSITPSRLEIGQGEEEGAQLANKGIKLLIEKKPAEALEFLQKAYPLMKKHPDNFRVLGNLATAYVMLGRRDEAMEMLRAALRANPDYNLARNNLHRLENLTPSEFQRMHKAGFYEKMNVINDREGSQRNE